MITKDNLKALLTSLDFKAENGLYSKHFAEDDFYLKVDFDKNEIIYPEAQGLIVNDRTTSNFSAPENFVVFECVHRLLVKGYKPQHIELEKEWKLGHGSGSGKADVLVKDQQNKMLLIIECKTDGKAFEDAWRTMLQNGGQLFAYMDRERTTRFLCLYASDFSAGKLTKTQYIIQPTDIGNLVEQFENKQNKPLFYKDITEVKQWYEVWNETYKKEYKTLGIFEDDVQAYNIGKENIAETDLQNITEKDIQGKYHEFATTLRKYNVSGRENAFDKLVNLFLCKIVDEKRNPHQLDFYWRGQYADSSFDLQDRLQKLYQAGMKEFLGEDVTYIDNKQIDDAFRYVKNDPDATKDTIKKFFTQLKFFTNNDFAFIDVHNEKLFYQNAVVLLEIVRMLQDIRLCTNDQNQFLGDLFEGFLDAGVKQSEGQFFTPMPITKFILLSLPLQNIINKTLQPPKMIDYACGSGHFLNELAAQIKPFVEAKKQNIDTYLEQIVGIEKEYRLSKVAKVSAFMYGQDQIKVVYADALAQHNDVKDNSFSVLVANPPYAVKGFLETLHQTDQDRYTLLKYIDSKAFSKNNSIQCFFIERAKQLLQPGGVAGIVLPSSVLSNTKSLEIATRELIIQYFDIVAIAEFGNKTFGKTGTNTVTLFLRRKQENPAPANQFRNRVSAWFNKNTDNKELIFEDQHLLKAYCQHIEIPFEIYQDFLQNGVTEACMVYEIFEEYQKEFEKSAGYKETQKKYNGQLRKENKTNIEADRDAELKRKFDDYAQKIETDKVYYFVLAAQQQQVLIVKSPADGKAQKAFLGYDWSGAKGKEGIKYLGGSNKAAADNEDDKPTADVSFDEAEDKRILENLSNMKNINTPLYDPNDRNNNEKINYLIQQNFTTTTTPIPDNLQPFVSYSRLEDLLDFSRKDFNKALSLTAKKNVNIESKWELVKIGSFAETGSGGTPLSNIKEYYENGDILWINSGEVKKGIITQSENKISQLGLNNSSAKIFPINTVLIAMYGATAGQVGILGVEASTNQAVCGVLPNDKYKPKYLFYFLDTQLDNLLDLRAGVARLNLSQDVIKNFKIPLPPLDVQRQIVAECEAIGQAVGEAQKVVEEASSRIDEIVLNTNFEMQKLGTIAQKITESIDPQSQSGTVNYVGLENIESNTGRLVGNTTTLYSINRDLQAYRSGL